MGDRGRCQGAENTDGLYQGTEGPRQHPISKKKKLLGLLTDPDPSQEEERIDPSRGAERADPDRNQEPGMPDPDPSQEPEQTDPDRNQEPGMPVQDPSQEVEWTDLDRNQGAERKGPFQNLGAKEKDPSHCPGVEGTEDPDPFRRPENTDQDQIQGEGMGGLARVEGRIKTDPCRELESLSREKDQILGSKPIDETARFQ